MLENLPIPILGNVVGSLFDVPQGRKVLDWFEPLDDTATKYKQVNIAFGGDTGKLMRLSEINEQLGEGILGRLKGGEGLDSKIYNALVDEKLRLEDELGDILDFDDVMRRSDIIENTERSARAANKLDNIEQLELDLGIDPDISPAAFDEGAKGGTIPPAGNVARNMADTAAIRQGVSKGDPAPIITDSMIKKGLMIGPESRDVVRGVAEAARDAGRFNAVVDGFRFSSKEMNAAAWGIYNDIITAGSVDDIREFFLDNMDVKNLLGGMMKVEYASEDAARAAAGVRPAAPEPQLDRGRAGGDVLLLGAQRRREAQPGHRGDVPQRKARAIVEPHRDSAAGVGGPRAVPRLRGLRGGHHVPRAVAHRAWQPLLRLLPPHGGAP